MSDPFASALDVLFRAPGSEAAVHISVHGIRTEGLRIIRGRADRAIRYGDGQVVSGTHLIELRQADLTEIHDGDQMLTGLIDDAGAFQQTGEYVLTGEPMSDAEALTWTIGAEPVDPAR